MNYSRKVVIFVLGKHETALVGYAGLCPDSAIQSSLMALAAPSVRQSLSKSWLSSRLIAALQEITENQSIEPRDIEANRMTLTYGKW